MSSPYTGLQQDASVVNKSVDPDTITPVLLEFLCNLGSIFLVSFCIPNLFIIVDGKYLKVDTEKYKSHY